MMIEVVRLIKRRRRTRIALHSQQVHDTLLKHGFEITNLKGIVDLHKDKLESIDKQLGIVNQELCKLNLQVEHLATALEKQNEIMLQQIQEKKK